MSKQPVFGQINSNKRPIQEMSEYTDVPAGALGQCFKSKADFVNYWQTMLQVRIVLSFHP